MSAGGGGARGGGRAGAHEYQFKRVVSFRVVIQTVFIVSFRLEIVRLSVSFRFECMTGGQGYGRVQALARNWELGLGFLGSKRLEVQGLGGFTDTLISTFSAA